MHLPNTRHLCQDVWGNKKRYDYQTYFTPFSVGNPYKGIRERCLGCKTCYMHFLPGGLGREPEPFKKIFPEIRRGIEKGRAELVTDLIEPFLNIKVAPLIIKIHRELPEARFNLITKLPLIAKRVLIQFPELQDVPYHFQVTTVKDGSPMPDIVSHVEDLLTVAKSVSCRVDPFVFGVSNLHGFLNHIRDLAKIGVKRITTNTMKLYRGQRKLLPDLDLNVYSDGDTAGSARLVNADVEYEYFKAISKQCKRYDVALGICMSRPQVRIFETAPCEGIALDEY